MPNTKFLGKRPENTIERLLKLRKDADKAGDTDTRDKLGVMIEEQGGTVPNGDIPKDETKMSRLERLRIEAIDCGDTDSAEKLAALIAEEQTVDMTSYDERAKERTAPPEGAEAIRMTEDELRAEVLEEAEFQTTRETSDTPHEGRNLVDKMKEAHAGMKFKAPVVVPSSLDQGVHTPPESEEERLEGPQATPTINDGTSSVNAAALIAKEGFILSEIPARFDGKVDVIDVKRYGAMLTQV